jgi:hypothetical protein
MEINVSNFLLWEKSKLTEIEPNQSHVENENKKASHHVERLVNKHHQASNLTFAVTLGFPSRSPPIHEPNLIGVHVNGSGLPVCYIDSIKMKDLKFLEGVNWKLKFIK